MTTPIAEMNLSELIDEAAPSFAAEALAEWRADVERCRSALVELRREVAIATARCNEAEGRTHAKPAHWQEAHGELVRLRGQLNVMEGDALMLRSELERRVRRVRTGGGQ